MKSVDVEIHTFTQTIYEWTCPHCSTKNSHNAPLNYPNEETIACRKCRTILYRLGPGSYGTEPDF